jgi:hypothetical protein
MLVLMGEVETDGRREEFSLWEFDDDDGGSLLFDMASNKPWKYCSMFSTISDASGRSARTSSSLWRFGVDFVDVGE